MWLERRSDWDRLDANIGGEITPLLGMWHSRLTDYVVGKLIVPGLDLSLMAEDVIQKEPWILLFYGKS